MRQKWLWFILEAVCCKIQPSLGQFCAAPWAECPWKGQSWCYVCGLHSKVYYAAKVEFFLLRELFVKSEKDKGKKKKST